MKNGQFVYKSENALQRMQDFYDKTLADLQVPFSEDYFETSFGKTHSLVVGNPEKPKICTIHGGNGITTLNLKLFVPLLNDFCIIAPDVIGMPGKSAPYRNINSSKDFSGQIKQMKIESKHLPSDEVMKDVCKEIVKFLA